MLTSGSSSWVSIIKAGFGGRARVPEWPAYAAVSDEEDILVRIADHFHTVESIKCVTMKMNIMVEQLKKVGLAGGSLAR